MGKKILPSPPKEYNQEYMNKLARTIELNYTSIDLGKNRYVIQNSPAVVTTIDFNTATQDQKNAFLLTVIQDIINRGLLP